MLLNIVLNIEMWELTQDVFNGDSSRFFHNGVEIFLQAAFNPFDAVWYLLRSGNVELFSEFFFKFVQPVVAGFCAIVDFVDHYLRNVILVLSMEKSYQLAQLNNTLNPCNRRSKKMY